MPGGEGSHRPESCHGGWRDSRLRPPGQHDVEAASPNHFECLADRVRPGGAGGGDREVEASGTKPNCDLSWREIADDGRNEERRDLPRTTGGQGGMSLLDAGETAEAKSHDDAH